MNEPAPISPGQSLAALRRDCRSAILATTNADGSPDSSYAPFVDGGAGAFFIFVSGLARHTANLLRTRRTSVMLIEDESAAGQIFGRRRATFSCRVEPVLRNDATWSPTIEAMRARHGAVVNMLRDLPDFQLLRLAPESGQLVLGFGKAFRLTGPACDEIEAIGPR